MHHDPLHPGASGDGTPQHGAQVRERLEALGRVSAELLDDLSHAVSALEARARLAAGEARTGRLPLGALETIVAASADVGAMLRDAVEALRGEELSPEVLVDVRDAMDAAVDRLVLSTGPVDVRLSVDLPPGTAVHGRASFLARALGAVLESAARRARGQVRVTASLVGPGTSSGRAVVRLAVWHDGPETAPAPEAARAGATAWLVAQLRGELRHGARGEGAFAEIHLPAVLPRARRQRGANPAPEQEEA